MYSVWGPIRGKGSINGVYITLVRASLNVCRDYLASNFSKVYVGLGLGVQGSL